VPPQYTRIDQITKKVVEEWLEEALKTQQDPQSGGLDDEAVQQMQQVNLNKKNRKYHIDNSTEYYYLLHCCCSFVRSSRLCEWQPCLYRSFGNGSIVEKKRKEMVMH